ncbi:MAG TPA: YceI family protein [Casimicrobiaceae bacterium]|nr:YceI family protein [Casimicrobiaceae bacterium]
MRRFAAIMLAAAVTVPVSGGANAQGVVVEKSEIRFVSRQMGVNVEGRFRKWKANVVFVPTDLGHSKAELDVDLASIDLASDDSEGEVKGPLWFDTARFPVAHFASTAIRNTGPDRYDVAGKLSMKGITRDATVPIVVRKDGSGTTIAEGTFNIKRLDYKIGEGEWADTQTVEDPVVVRVRMVLAPAK